MHACLSGGDQAAEEFRVAPAGEVGHDSGIVVPAPTGVRINFEEFQGAVGGSAKIDTRKIAAIETLEESRRVVAE